MKKSALLVTMLTISLALGGCGLDDSPEIRAMNLQTGEIEIFPPDQDLPPGYMLCPDEECTISNQVPCEALGGEVCELNPKCRLKVLWCDGGSDIVPETSGGSAGASDEDPANMEDPPLMPHPEICEVACLTIGPLLCEELSDPLDCQARSDCEWSQAMCPSCLVSSDGSTADCECSSSCHTKQAPICQDLDQQACSVRPDCQWEQRDCPPCEDATMCSCPSNGCMPNQSQVCPPMAGAYPVCVDGSEPIPVYDAMGCLTHYDCGTVPGCPPVEMPAIGCESGAPLIPVYDEAGCVVNWQCPNTALQPCQRTGCSGQVCAAEEVATDCMWSEQYQCYDQAICGVTANGTCGWIDTPEFMECMETFN